MSFTTVPAKSPGDVYSATPMWNTYLKDNLNKGVMRPIAEVTVAGSVVASITFSSIAADWSHLMLVAYLAGDTAASSLLIQLRLNNDTTANYDSQTLSAAAAAVAAVETLAATSARVGTIPGSTASNKFAALQIQLPHYANAANQKSLYSACAKSRGNASGDVSSEINACQWRSNNAVDQISLIPATGNIAIGSRATLYGMGGI